MRLFRLAVVLVSLVINAGCTQAIPKRAPPDPPVPAQAIPASSLPAGLIYSPVVTETFPIYWMSGKDGTATQLADLLAYGLPIPAMPSMDFSSDGTRGISFQLSGTPLEHGRFNFERGDIVMLDTKTGQKTQLTNDPTHINWFPRWWRGNPNTLIFMSSKPGPNAAQGSGSLGMVNADGSGYRIYEDIPYNKAVPSTDGKTLLYMLQSDPKNLHLLTLDGQTRVIDPATYPGFKLVETTSQSDPSSCIAQDGQLSKGNTSPDASIVSWSVCLSELTFINLQDPAKTFSLTSSFSPGLISSALLPIWSSDNQYFALIASSNSVVSWQTDNNIRIFDRNGKLLGQIDRPHDMVTSLQWRPGTHEFLYTLTTLDAMTGGHIAPPPYGPTPVPTSTTDSQPEAIIFNVDTGASVEINLPSPIVVQGWVSVQ